MSSQVWRFSYKEDSLKSIVESGRIEFPDLNDSILGKHNSIEKILSDMSVGCFVVLANFDDVESIGVVRAAGIVKNKKEGVININWKKVVPGFSVHPHKIGSEQWRTEKVFLINVPRVKQLKLDVLRRKLFP